MRLPNTTITVALAASMALASLSSTASAQTQQSVVAEPRDRAHSTRPNRALMTSGVLTLGLSYVPAAIVGIESDLSADKNLLIPVAGPWMNYAERDCPECQHEKTNKMLLVTDGIVQGIGALQILGSLLFVEPRPGMADTATPKRTAKSRFKITPTRFETGSYGFTARGNF